MNRVTVTPRRFVAGLVVAIATAALGACSTTAPSSAPQTSGATQSSTVANIEPFSYDIYADVLATYVNDDGFVDYAGLQQDRAALDQFAATIGQVSPATYDAWSDDEKMAFLINAYNVFTLQSIIDQTPLKSSIRDIPGVWRARQFAIAGQSKTLDNIEHDTLRKEFAEPRIHAAVNCASISCPVLRQEPFIAEKLDQQLDEQVSRWLLSPEGIQIDRDAGEVKLSSIFDWFGEDWIPAYSIEEGFSGSDKQKAALNFISQYLSDDDAAYLEAGDYRVKYLDYNWALNQQP